MTMAGTIPYDVERTRLKDARVLCLTYFRMLLTLKIEVATFENLINKVRAQDIKHAV